MSKRGFRLAAVALGVMAMAAVLLAPAVFAAGAGQNTPPPTNLPYLFAAFAVVWVFLFGYMFYTARRQDELERTLYELKQSLGEGAAKKK